jgi:hypothetical protein
MDHRTILTFLTLSYKNHPDLKIMLQSRHGAGNCIVLSFPAVRNRQGRICRKSHRKIPEIDNLLELLQIAEEMMFQEKNKNPQLALTHKMLQGVLRDYHEFSKVN